MIICVLNAVSRKLPNLSPNTFLKIRWYLFADGYTLFGNGHVRVDIVNTHLHTRVGIWTELAGTVLILFPFSLWVLC